MPNKLKITIFTLCIISTFLCSSATQNQILSTGIRKISDNTVNFTFYTQGESAEKPIVKSKGGNEYTILLPNLSDNSSGGINLNAAGGLVTSADVKTINEGAVTYTKINVKTSKPLTINAETRKTSQSASDLSNLNSIVSKVNLINQDIKTTKNIPAETPSAKASETNVVKSSAVKDIIRQNSASAPKKNAIQDAVAQSNVSSHTPNINKVEKTEISKQKNENIKNIKPVSNVSKTINTQVQNPIPQQKQAPQTADEQPMNDIVSVNTAVDDVSIIPENVPENQVKDMFLPVEKHKSSFIDRVKEILFSPLATIIILTSLLISVFALLFKKLTSNLSISQSINDSFIEKLNSILNKPKEKDYSKIVNDESMSWQEKYRAFNETNKSSQNKEKKKIDGNYVLEISNDKSEEKPQSVDGSHKFNGFDAGTEKVISKPSASKLHNLKSFNNQSVSKQDMIEKLDNISDKETAESSDHLVDMRILLSSSIDNDKEFYVVSENGLYSLLGRVKNRLVILKHLGHSAPQDLQVLRGQGNSFVVKAGDYRTQVDVTDTDMNLYSNV